MTEQEIQDSLKRHGIEICQLKTFDNHESKWWQFHFDGSQNPFCELDQLEAKYQQVVTRWVAENVFGWKLSHWNDHAWMDDDGNVKSFIEPFTNANDDVMVLKHICNNWDWKDVKEYYQYLNRQWLTHHPHTGLEWPGMGYEIGDYATAAFNAKGNDDEDNS